MEREFRRNQLSRKTLDHQRWTLHTGQRADWQLTSLILGLQTAQLTSM